MPFYQHQRMPSVPLTPRPFSPSIITASISSETSAEIYTSDTEQFTPETTPSTCHHPGPKLSATRRNPTESPSSCRWSDIVPPNSALTFAVVWDPEDDMVAFSGAELFEDSNEPSSSSSENSPTSPTDACSQILTIPLSENTGIYTGTLQYFRENHDWLFNEDDHDGGGRFRLRSSLGLRERLKLGQTQASSTMGELDVYLRGSLMGMAHRENTKKFHSCFGVLDGKFEFDPKMEFEEMWAKIMSRRSRVATSTENKDEIEDEGFFEVEFEAKKLTPAEMEAPLKRPRSPGLSTDNREAFDDEDDLLSWQTIECPEEIHRLSIACLNMVHPNEPRRQHPKLKKRRRPSDIPCPPAEVLQREIFSHQVSLEPEPPRLTHAGVLASPLSSKEPCSPIGKLCRTLSAKRNRGYPLERWDCVEVVQDKEKTARAGF
ncbi:hypothetical protein E1B28_006696 [Marasmius oreades]|uniref:Uncharacterized protein n=1 Tax=Marasmius oreades TaxID=181124 RepID=A0A9P8AAG5_9AGAR|nr:uncharacterized protein E1B28_006696 [Marasmius oreades]KAG7096014.1 hypothetical protein E1B28_006696 [Marasmius oreades]